MTTAATNWYCVGCQRHLDQAAFNKHKHRTKQTTTCIECDKKADKERTLVKREGIIETAVQRIISRLSKDTKNELQTPWGDRILRGMGRQSEVDQLVSDAIRDALQPTEHWRARIEGVKAYERLQNSLDATQDHLKSSLAKLSDDELAQLGLALLTRALAADGNLELLSDLASQYGYRLVKEDVLDGIGTPTSERCEEVASG